MRWQLVRDHLPSLPPTGGSWKGWLRIRQATITPLLLLAPGGLLFSIFVLYPIFASIKLAFYDWSGIGPATWVGLANFRELFADPVFYKALLNNLIWLLCIIAAPIMGLGAALLLNQPLRGFGVLRSVFFLPFVISQVVVGMIFGWFFNADFGLLNAVLPWVGLPAVAPLDSERWAIIVVILAALWPQTAYCLMLYLAGLTGIDATLVDAARLDGAHGWQVLWHVVMPQLWPVHFIVAMVCIVSALRAFDLVMIMTRGGPYDSSSVLALYMYEQTFSNFRYGYGAAIATVLFAMMSAGVGFFFWRMLRGEER